ncbi:MAG: hypothetical protein HKN47_08240 [Pirellulaceae bacterium]|nr:hypothetical protein [Pirellulaceae bacterium]
MWIRKSSLIVATSLAITCSVSSVKSQEATEDIEITSLILINRDIFEASRMMTIFDLDDDGFIDSQERKKLSWHKDYKKFDINKDAKLTHLEVALQRATARAEFGITQFDINNAQAMIRRRDDNRNGQIDPAEIAKGWPTRPEDYDKNDNGIITLFEVARDLAFKRGLRRELGIEAVDNMSSVNTIKRFDTDKDFQLNADEWVAAQLPREAKQHDDDGDGKLSQTELAILFSKHRRETGLSKSDAVKAKQLIAMADHNRDGKIDEKEMTMGIFGLGDTQAKTFEQYDADSDGFVTLAEIQSTIASEREQKGFDDTDLAEAKRLMVRFDRDRSTFMEPHEYPDGSGQLSKRKLATADLNNDVRLSVEELAKHLAKE